MQQCFHVGDQVRTTCRIDGDVSGATLPKGTHACVYELSTDSAGFAQLLTIDVENFLYDVRPEEVELCNVATVQSSKLQKSKSDNGSKHPVAKATSKADRFWKEGVLAYFGGDIQFAIGKFEASLSERDASAAAPLARRAFFCACRLLDNGHGLKAMPLLQEAVRLDPELCEAHVELCLALSSHALHRALRTAVATAIVEGGLWVNQWQRPAVFLSGLESQPFWDAARFPWTQELEKRYKDMRVEVDGLLARNLTCWSPVGGDHRSSGQSDSDALLRGSWEEVVLFGLVESEVKAGQAAAPVTASIVKLLIPEAVEMAEAGAGEVILSALSPNTHVAPHCARSNHRLTVHLGMRIPTTTSAEKNKVKQQIVGDTQIKMEENTRAPCGIRVGGKCQKWQEGQVMVFDDSYEHEVWNDTDSTRVVLLIRFWHPVLDTKARRAEALTRVEASLARSQRLQLLPPLAPSFQEPSEAVERLLRGSDELCLGCGKGGMGGELDLDEVKGRVTMVMNCCGLAVE